jgi:hypothetical protein
VVTCPKFFIFRQIEPKPVDLLLIERSFALNLNHLNGELIDFYISEEEINRNLCKIFVQGVCPKLNKQDLRSPPFSSGLKAL